MKKFLIFFLVALSQQLKANNSQATCTPEAISRLAQQALDDSSMGSRAEGYKVLIQALNQIRNNCYKPTGSNDNGSYKTCVFDRNDGTGFGFLSRSPYGFGSYGTLTDGAILELLGERAIGEYGIAYVKIRLIRNKYRSSLDAQDGTEGWTFEDNVRCY